jgi:hypothetical protein
LPLFVAGLLRDRGVAERLITSLIDSGISSGEISLAVREVAEEDVTERDEIAAGVGAGEGGNEFAALAVHSAWERLGWLGGARPPYRDTIPPDIEFAILTAGPLAIAIGGAQVGASGGGIVGSMGNFGFPLGLAKEWYDRIVKGHAWVMVRASEGDERKLRPLFHKYGAELPAESTRHW